VAAASTPVSGARRTAAVLTWRADSRSVRIGPGVESYLEIHENFNAGWQATLNGRRLTPVTLDGWQQAFIVPAGQGGLIRLSYGPTTAYHAGLIASALALVALAVQGRNRRRGSRWRRTSASPHRQHWSARLSARWSPHGSPHGPRRGANDPSTRQRVRRGARAAGAFVPLAVVIGLAGGPAVLAVPVLACLGWWRPRWLPPVALGAMLIAGVVAASASSPIALGGGAFGGVAQACALVALTAALMPVTARASQDMNAAPAGDSGGVGGPVDTPNGQESAT
jgi:arabinofuranan 3-O-arabinosyltransferase